MTVFCDNTTCEHINDYGQCDCEKISVENGVCMGSVRYGRTKCKTELIDVLHMVEEDAKLRKRVAELEELLPENGKWFSAETVEAYVAEIAKLRELARHLYECMCNVDADGNHECDSCEYDNTEDGCNFERLMRELGIEVTND